MEGVQMLMRIDGALSKGNSKEGALANPEIAPEQHFHWLCSVYSIASIDSPLSGEGLYLFVIAYALAGSNF